MSRGRVLALASAANCQHFQAGRNASDPLNYCNRRDAPPCEFFSRPVQIGVRQGGISGFRQVPALGVFEEKSLLFEAQVRALEGGEHGWFARAALEAFKASLAVRPVIDCRGIAIPQDYKVYSEQAIAIMEMSLVAQACQKMRMDHRRHAFYDKRERLSAKSFTPKELQEALEFIEGLGKVTDELCKGVGASVGRTRSREGMDLITVFNLWVKSVLQQMLATLREVQRKQEAET